MPVIGQGADRPPFRQMEVSVLRAEGAVQEPDTVVSIRAGAARRQGPLQLGRTLRFPSPAGAGPAGPGLAGPLKVDVLRRLGAAEVAVLPQGGIYSVPLEPSHGDTWRDPHMQVQLRISSKPLLCGRARSDVKDPAGEQPEQLGGEDASGSAAQARRYFEGHNVMPVVQALLEALLRDQPEEPHRYIAAFMESIAAREADGPEDVVVHDGA